MGEREAYIGFSVCGGIGPWRFKLLIDYFGSAAAAWEADEQTLVNIGLGQILTHKFIEFRRNFDAKKYENSLLGREIKIVTKIDPTFPTLLLTIPDPPIALFFKGKLPDAKPLIAVVGSRKPTPYGRQVTETITRGLVAHGFVIVSGLARGIDGITHRVSMGCGGETIAVLGCGVDIVYPPEHTTLYNEIITDSGAVVSEVPPGQRVLKGLFPARNRIIAGLSLGVVITEGAEDSGSLITARYAAEQGREVFAVPGPITSYLSAGPAKLIKQGAKVVTGIADILDELQIRPVPGQKVGVKKQKGAISGDAEKIYDLLSVGGEMHYDEIVRMSQMTANQVGSILTSLELDGIIRALGNGKYALRDA